MELLDKHVGINFNVKEPVVSSGISTKSLDTHQESQGFGKPITQDLTSMEGPTNITLLSKEANLDPTFKYSSDIYKQAKGIDFNINQPYIKYGSQEYLQSKGFYAFPGKVEVKPGIAIAWDKYFKPESLQELNYSNFAKYFDAPKPGEPNYWARKARYEAITDLNTFQTYWRAGGLDDLRRYSRDSFKKFARFVGVNWERAERSRLYGGSDDWKTLEGRYYEHITEPMNYWNSQAPDIMYEIENATSILNSNRTYVQNQITEYQKQYGVTGIPKDFLKQYEPQLNLKYSDSITFLRKYFDSIGGAYAGEQARMDRNAERRLKEQRRVAGSPIERLFDPFNPPPFEFNWGSETGFQFGPKEDNNIIPKQNNININLQERESTRLKGINYSTEQVSSKGMKWVGSGWDWLTKQFKGGK